MIIAKPSSSPLGGREREKKLTRAGTPRTTRTSLGAVLSLALTGGAAPLFAQSYPEKPIRIIVNVSAGGGVDTTARVVAQHLNSVFRQPVVVDNRTGAGGSIGIELVSKASPDGYTLLVCSSGIVTNAAFRPENYDPVRDFQPVSNLVSMPYIVVTTPSLAVKSVQDLIALAKAKPETLRYATSGVGGIIHLGSELFEMLSNTKMVSVPYKGSADAYPAVANGDVHWMIGASISALPLVNAGRLRALAVTSPQRSKALPNLPTVAESGVPGFEVVGWFAMFAPRGTPMPIVERLSAESRRGLQGSAFARTAEAQGNEVVGSSPSELARLVKTELETWRKVVANAGIKQ
jgi:tripartite-type tricarboxylate transporter receptor subunit TctC